MKQKQTNENPFVPYKLEEEREITPEKVFSIRLNKEEALWLEELKEDLNIKSDGKALKISAFIGKNVLQSLLGRKNLRYLFKKEREKLSDFKNY